MKNQDEQKNKPDERATKPTQDEPTKPPEVGDWELLRNALQQLIQIASAWNKPSR